MNLLEKLLLVKEMIIQLVACKIILISKENYNMISIDLSKQQALDGDPRAILQIILLQIYIDYEIEQHFHSLTNIRIFICNFACEMTITYF